MAKLRDFYAFDPAVREIRRLAAVLARRWRVFLVAATLPVVATLTYVVRAPDRYAGTARIIIAKSPDEEALEFTAAPGLPSNELANQLELIKSREVISSAAAAGRQRFGAAAPSEEELARALTVKRLKETDIIEITAEAPTAERAAAFANLVADAYMDAHVRDRRKRASGTKDFIEEQLRIYEQRLRASERALEDYKREAGITSLDAETAELIRTGATFQTELEKARVELAVATSRREYLEDELRATQARLLTASGDVSSPVARQLQDKLVALEFRYANLILKGYSPSHAEL